LQINAVVFLEQKEEIAFTQKLQLSRNQYFIKSGVPKLCVYMIGK